VPRPRLAARLRNAVEAGAVLVFAGAGFGKTTILAEAVGEAKRATTWVSCAAIPPEAGGLLVAVVDAIEVAVPGIAAFRERLAGGSERIDPEAGMRELLRELDALLVEPVVLVLDDAERLDRAPESLALVATMVRAHAGQLRVAIASRRALDLQVAREHATGTVERIGPADLAFTTEECAVALQVARGVEPADEEVEAIMDATHGWPLGIALLAREDRSRVERRGAIDRAELHRREAVAAFFREEVLDNLDPSLRERVIDSAVARTLTPSVVDALGLGDDFLAQVDLAGLLDRPLSSEEPSYHPLLREFLEERLDTERDADQRRDLHARIASAIEHAGDPAETIEHWLAAERWPEAAAAIEREGATALRTTPGLVQRWLSLLPPDVRSIPTLRALEGQLEWASGNNEATIACMQDAIRGFREHPNPPADWMARSVLADSLFATGGVDRIPELVEGWKDPAAEPAGVLAPAAVAYAAAVLAAYGRFEESDRLASAAAEHPDSQLLRPLQALQASFRLVPGGELDEVIEQLESAAAEMERFDPLYRRAHVLGSMAVVLSERGDAEDALRLWLQIREITSEGLAPLMTDVSHAWCALLHAQAGRLSEAEAELAQHKGLETGFRAFVADLAPPTVAALRGDAGSALDGAQRTTRRVEGAPTLFRSWVARDLATVLSAVGARARARALLDEMLVEVDEVLPGPSGRFVRGSLLAQRAWLNQIESRTAEADADLVSAWSAAGTSLQFILRREWTRLGPVVWGALERGAIAPANAIAAITEAFPDGAGLVPFVSHPVPEVRAAALEPAVGSGDPEVLRKLPNLARDPDEAVATAARRVAARASEAAPPLEIRVLGAFSVGRGAWGADEHDWSRPAASRLVRLLAIHRGTPVPEDMILEALWPKLSPAGARRSLRVAASRARRVLDLPGAERTAIEVSGGNYTLALSERDRVDAEEFEAAVAAGLSTSGDERRALLERARSLWTGEPLPEDRYEDWAVAWRQRLMDRRHELLVELGSTYAAVGEDHAALAVARELVEHDPLDESAQRMLMSSYARTGRRAQALRQYMACRRALVDELGIEPSTETSELHSRILAGEPA
jgi:DNA-binding SARP family transcriptional activator